MPVPLNIVKCPICKKFYTPKRHTEACPHRYISLQKKLDAGDALPK